MKWDSYCKAMQVPVGAEFILICGAVPNPDDPDQMEAHLLLNGPPETPTPTRHEIALALTAMVFGFDGQVPGLAEDFELAFAKEALKRRNGQLDG